MTDVRYPLSLNALTHACNQKSNREPVMEFDEMVVQQTVDKLIKKYLVSEESGYGRHVAKYRHRFCNTEYSTLKITPREQRFIQFATNSSVADFGCHLGDTLAEELRRFQIPRQHFIRAAVGR